MRGILYSRFMWEAHCVVAPLTVARYTLSIFRSLPVGCRLAILVSGWGYKKEGEEPKSPPPKTKEKKGGRLPSPPLLSPSQPAKPQSQHPSQPSQPPSPSPQPASPAS